MVTIHDVAKLAGVSIGTVSNVINNNKNVSPHTRDKVLAAIEELNYIPNSIAKSLKTNRSQIIGIIAEDISSFSTGDIIDGICNYCEDNNYTVNLTNLRVNRRVKLEKTFDYKTMEESDSFKNSVLNSLNTLLASRVCGLIYIGTHPRDVGHILPKLNVPIVYTYAYTKNDDYCINYDDFQGAKLAVDHIIKKGHKDIAMISGSIDSVPAHKRMMGFQTSLMEHNLIFNPKYIRPGNWLYEDGYEQTKELMRLDKPPTAIFAMNDLMAYGAINASMDMGLKISEDIAIHGFDNLKLSQYIYPRLSTVDLPLRKMGISAARTILEIIDERPPEKHSILIDCKHIARQTV